MWERKIFRTIYGGIKGGDLIRQRTNAEVMNLYGGCTISGVINRRGYEC